MPPTQPRPRKAPTPANPSSSASGRAWFGAALAVLLVALIWIGWTAAKAAIDRAEIQLPLLAIAGVLILLIALALTSISFATFGIEDKSEALALPSGSVRAVIALSLIIIFSILTVYLFATLSFGGTTEIVTNVTAQQRDDLLKKFNADQLTHISSRATGDIPDPSKGAKQGAVVPGYTVYNNAGPTPASQDFAKQLLVMLGVLLSSVTGFYFGAKTAQNAGDTTTHDPNDPNQQNQQQPPHQPQGGGAGGGGGGGQQAGDPAKLAAANLSATPEAAALGHDPTLASDPAADDLNKGAS